ncbi:hypothetical protein, partial [Plesiomonas shigelloides]|uniref:hypothetical protein n=1 Tax=Plesiomonas shigelloides TaxID=703 RepID=UPI001C49C9B5
MSGRVEVSAVWANVILFSFQSAGSAATDNFGIASFATIAKSYSFLLFAWCLAARNQRSFAQLKANA